MSDWPARTKLRVFTNRVVRIAGPAHIRAHRQSSLHRGDVLSSDFCGCFSCLETFPRSELEEWIDNEATPMCPKCGIDSVIGPASGFPVRRDFLNRMHEYWFERTHKIRS